MVSPPSCKLHTPQVRQEDVLSVWSGIRPLAADPTAAAAAPAADGASTATSSSGSSTASISRDHVIFSEPDGLITVTGGVKRCAVSPVPPTRLGSSSWHRCASLPWPVQLLALTNPPTSAGGKWTTYRRMAEDALDTALARGDIPVSRSCVTSRLKLTGGQTYTPTLHTQVWGDASVAWGRRSSKDGPLPRGILSTRAGSAQREHSACRLCRSPPATGCAASVQPAAPLGRRHARADRAPPGSSLRRPGVHVCVHVCLQQPRSSLPGAPQRRVLKGPS